MIGYSENRLPSELLNSHHHICDLIDVEYPVLSLYTDGRRNWMYLWCDKNALRTRWLLFTVARKLLVAYLQKKQSLKSIVEDAKQLWMLEIVERMPEPN